MLGTGSPDESFFNDLSQQPQSAEIESRATDGTTHDENGIPKPKRIACKICRRRKLRCDGARPTCGTCQRLNHDCEYDEVRRKSGPKRGYVKALEARLQQVETLLKTQDGSEPALEAQAAAKTPFKPSSLPPNMLDPSGLLTTAGESNMFSGNGLSPGDTFGGYAPTAEDPTEEPFPWEIISLGLDEPLPPQEDINELNDIYFTKVHPSIPMMHRPRYYAAMHLAPHMRPAVCLRYIMWGFAASLSDKYEPLKEHFYQRARKYAQLDEMRGHGESTLTLGHCQAWILICTYEFKHMYFPRAWMSAGRACRLAQMMGLGRQDGAALDVKQCLPPPKDWTEREERRRTFWGSFCVDRYASIGTGWPMTIDEKDILSNLPASDEAFEKSRPTPSVSLTEVLEPSGAGNLSVFGGVILMACLFGRNLHHLHRPTPNDRDDDLNGEFWKRHRAMQDTIDSTALNLPDSLRLPGAFSDVNAIFTIMCLHTSVICLHQASIFKAEKNRLPASVSNDSKIRCASAASEIASIMRAISHMDFTGMNPFIAFCVYVAARVFVQYLKTRPDDQQMTSSLQFLMQAMQSLKRRNPLTESFLVQLDLDLEGAGILGLRPNIDAHSHQVVNMPNVGDTVKCNPLFEIRDTQTPSDNGQIIGEQPIAPPNNPMSMFSNGSPGINLDVPPNAGSLNPGSANSQNNLRNTMRHPFGSMRDARQKNRSVRGIIVPVIDNSAEGSEMDTSPDASGDQATPSTTNSHRGSSSNTSFTPPHQAEEKQQQRSHGFNLARTPSTPIGVNASNLNSAQTPDFFANSGTDFSNMGSFYTTQANEGSNVNDYGMAAGWDMGATMGANGLTDGSWNSVLEGMGMGWDEMAQAPNVRLDPITGRPIH